MARPKLQARDQSVESSNQVSIIITQIIDISALVWPPSLSSSAAAENTLACSRSVRVSPVIVYLR